MSFTLSISTNPLVNRYAWPKDLIQVIGRDIGIGHVQMTHEFVNPSWPATTLAPLVSQMAAACAAENVRITSMMTGPYGRLNHFGHPDKAVRTYYVDWFKTLAEIAGDLGCPVIGTQYAILTYADYDDPARRAEILRIALDCWREVAAHGARHGLEWLLWEPMSVGRELGHTIRDAHALQDWIEADALPIPLKPMVDIDHGDVSSSDPADTDPFAWAREFATRSPIIHIKQSSTNKGGHWPFTRAHNEHGRIQPDTLLAALRAGGSTTNELCLELAFREREPSDRQVVAALNESVQFWKHHTQTKPTPDAA